MVQCKYNAEQLYIFIPDAVGYLKGKSAIRIHRDLSRVKGTLFGRSFWARGYCVSMVGLDESTIRQYIQDQEQHQKDQEQDELNVT